MYALFSLSLWTDTPKRFSTSARKLHEDKHKAIFCQLVIIDGAKPRSKRIMQDRLTGPKSFITAAELEGFVLGGH